LEKWSPELSSIYVNNFCNSRSRPELIAKFELHFSDNASLKEIFDNPLLLTLFLIIVEEEEMSLPLDVIDKSSLYNRAIYVWAKRDLSRKPASLHTDQMINKVIRSWQLIAWLIYKCRFRKDVLTFAEMLLVINDKKNEIDEIDSVKDVVKALLDIRLHTERVYGFIHEELLEYLAACCIISGFITQKNPFPETLRYAIRSEINKFVIGEIRSYEIGVKIKILEVLENEFKLALQYGNEEAIITRNQAAYYIGRLETPEATKSLLELDALETNITVKLSISFGLVKNKNTVKEGELYGKLTAEQDWDRANRGYHLFYYQDWVGTSGPPFYDPEDITWGRTLKALVSHLKSDSLRHLLLARIEMFTIMRFIVTRQNVGNLTEPLLDDIEKNLIKLKEMVSLEFYQKASVVFDELKKIWCLYAPSD
jgi:hypothetical protein